MNVAYILVKYQKINKRACTVWEGEEWLWRGEGHKLVNTWRSNLCSNTWDHMGYTYGCWKNCWQGDCNTTGYDLWKITAITEHPWWLQKGLFYIQTKEEWGGVSKELYNGWPHLSPWKNRGACPLGINFQHVKDKTIIKKSQQGFTKSKSCLTNVVAHYDEMTGHADEGREGDARFLSGICLPWAQLIIGHASPWAGGATGTLEQLSSTSTWEDAA